MKGSIWPMRRSTRIEDLYDRRVVVYRNTLPAPINRPAQADYIWVIADYKTDQKLALATEVPLVGGPLVWINGGNPAVVGRIPPGQLILTSAFPVTRNDWGRRLGECICTSDGEVWASGNMPPVRYAQC